MRPIQAKTILSSARNPPDPYFGGLYNINLYRGCPHGCIYCDTRSDCYGIGDLSDLRYKDNALAILDDELGRRRRKGTVTTGSMNDPYQPWERRLKLTRGALKLMAAHGFGVHVITKGNLVARDADVLRRVGRVYAAVSFTVTTTDSDLARVIEPGAPPPELRFRAMARLARAGIYTGLTFMPVLPFITDTPENVRAVLEQASAHGARYAIFFPGMTLRDSCRAHYYAQLDKHFPGLKERSIHAYGNQYGCDSPRADELWRAYSKTCSGLGLATRMRFYEPPRQEQLSLL